MTNILRSSNLFKQMLDSWAGCVLVCKWEIGRCFQKLWTGNLWQNYVQIFLVFIVAKRRSCKKDRSCEMKSFEVSQVHVSCKKSWILKLRRELSQVWSKSRLSRVLFCFKSSLPSLICPRILFGLVLSWALYAVIFFLMFPIFVVMSRLKSSHEFIWQISITFRKLNVVCNLAI